jgi:hypothetical protein
MKKGIFTRAKILKISSGDVNAPFLYDVLMIDKRGETLLVRLKSKTSKLTEEQILEFMNKEGLKKWAENFKKVLIKELTSKNEK